MVTLRRGERRKLRDLGAEGPLVLSLQAGLTGADVSLLGLDERGRLSDERQFVFYNQPGQPGGPLTTDAVASGGRGNFHVDLHRLPAGVARLLVVASHDSLPLSGVRGGRLQVCAPDGQRCVAEHAFDGTDFREERAALIAEVYRKDGEWRLGILAQGFNGGLSELLRQYGGDVSESPARADAPPPFVPPRPSPVPPPPTPAAHPPTSGRPSPGPVPTPQPSVASSLLSGLRDLLGSRTSPSTTATSAARPPAPPLSSPPAPAPPPAPLRLEKNQTISLEKTAGKTLTRVIFGLGWDPARAGTNIDLDASCVMLAGRGEEFDTVYFGHLRSRDGSVQHTGDNLTGEGDGDDEQILVDLSRVPTQVTTLVFTINSYRGHRFNEVRNAFCRVVDHSSGREVARYNLSDGSPSTAMLMAKVQRRSDGWHMTALGEAASGRVVRDILDVVRRHA